MSTSFKTYFNTYSNQFLHTNGTDCAVENDGSLVICEFVDERGILTHTSVLFPILVI